MDDYLECPCCGDVGIHADKDGMYTDGVKITCGCVGQVSVDEEEAWINISELKECPEDAPCRRILNGN